MRHPPSLPSLVVAALLSSHCAGAPLPGAGAGPVARPALDALPPECGEPLAVPRADVDLSFEERDTLSLLSDACRGAVRERDSLGAGACASQVGQFASWRDEALRQAAGAARARESGDFAQATIVSRRLRALREAADGRGAGACAAREPDLLPALRR